MRNLIYGDYTIGDLRIEGTGVFGQNGPEFPEIILNAELTLDPYKSSGDVLGAQSDDREEFPYTVTDLAGTLNLNADSGASARAPSLCPLQSDLRPSMVDRAYDRTVKLSGQLTPHVVNELEKHREGGDLHLQVSCALTIHFEDVPPSSGRFGHVEEDIDVTVPRSHWTDNVYPDLGGREVYVIEIPKGSRSIETAWKKIEDARDARQNWNAEGASIACREAADVMDRAVREHFGKRNCTYKQRWKRAYKGVENQASLAGHLQEIKSEASCEQREELKVGQADLECLIIRTQSLLKYAEALIRES
jgi:hypothetical protein